MRKVGDLVLIYYMGKPSVYARIETIEPDIKEGWYQVELLVLSIPAQIVRWILRREYLDGTTFTMKGIPIRLGDIYIDPSSKSSKNAEQRLTKEHKKDMQKKKNIKNQKLSKIIYLQKHKDNV